MKDEFTLKHARAKLASLEDSIIDSIKERCGFFLNRLSYYPGFVKFDDGFQGSLFEYVLQGRENSLAVSGMYTSFAVKPFFPIKAKSLMARKESKSPVADIDVNLNDRIRMAYVSLLPKLCSNYENDTYGESIERDIQTLQVLSYRVHYGLLIAELKYRESPDKYRKLIEERDINGIMETLTVKHVEDEVVARVLEKTKKAAKLNRNILTMHNPEQVAAFFKDTLIPLTKEAEVEYLLKRNNTNPQS